MVNHTLIYWHYTFIQAFITTLGFGWLVGPSEVVEVDVEYNGKPQVWKSGVHIKKCRYLENSGCVGMCTNMCKVPTHPLLLCTMIVLLLFIIESILSDLLVSPLSIVQIPTERFFTETFGIPSK